MLDTKC